MKLPALPALTQDAVCFGLASSVLPFADANVTQLKQHFVTSNSQHLFWAVLSFSPIGAIDFKHSTTHGEVLFGKLKPNNIAVQGYITHIIT